MTTAGGERNRTGRQHVGAAWEKNGASGRFLALEIDAGALLADALRALIRGEERVTYLAFTNDKKPGGREDQPEHRIIRPLRRSPESEAV